MKKTRHNRCRPVSVAVVSVLQAALFLSCGSGDKTEWNLTDTVTRPVTGITSLLVDDWNDDGYDEIYWADSSRGEVYFDDSLRGDQKQFHLDDFEFITGLVDLNGDGTASLAMTRLVPDERAWISFHDIGASSFPSNPEPVLEIRGFQNPGYDFRTDHEWRCQPVVCGLADFNGDGTSDLVVRVFTGYELIPRGLWIYDGESLRRGGTPEILCKKEMKAYCKGKSKDGKRYMPFVADIDGDEDQRPEILVSTVASDNWTIRVPPEERFEGRLDDRERVVLLKVDPESGELEEAKVWEPADPNGALSAHPGPMIPGGGHFFYLFRPLREEGDQAGKIEKIRGRTLKAEGRPFRFNKRTKGLLSHFERSSSFEGLVVTYMDGSIDLLDKDLKRTNSGTPRKNLPLRPHVVTDLDKNGSAELVASSGNDLFVLSLPDLEIMAVRSLPSTISGAQVKRNGDEVPDLCVSVLSPFSRNQGKVGERKKNDLYRYRMVEDVLPSRSYLAWLISSFIAGAAATAAVVMFTARRRRLGRRKRTAAEISRCDDFLETLRSVGFGKTAASTLEQLRMIFEQLNLDPAPDHSLTDHLKELAESFRRNAWPQLVRIPPAARSAQVAPALVKAYEEALLVLRKALLDTEIADLDSPALDSGLVLNAMGTLSMVRKRMVEELAAFIRCDPVQVAEEMLQAAAVNATEAGVEIEPLTVRLKPGVRAFVRESDLKVILEDLLVNASRAVSGCSEKRIRLSIDTCGERIFIDLSDTGSGIPDDLKNRIFEPAFSTKERGGGLGLFQAVEILDRYGGRIFVARTAADKGTTMRIELIPT